MASSGTGAPRDDKDPNEKISMPLYRRREANAQLMKYKCVEFTEELLYGHLRKKP